MKISFIRLACATRHLSERRGIEIWAEQSLHPMPFHPNNLTVPGRGSNTIPTGPPRGRVGGVATQPGSARGFDAEETDMDEVLTVEEIEARYAPEWVLI